MASPTITIRVKPLGQWDRNLSFDKDPSDVLAFALDFTQFLQTDTISTKTVEGTNITVDSSTLSSNIVTIVVSAGTAGTQGIVKTTIVTSGGRTFERSFRLDIEDR